MAITLRRTLAPEWWTPENEDGSIDDNPSRFLIKCLTAPDVEAVMSRNSAGFSADNNRHVLQLGLIDWEGIIDPDTGDEVKYSESSVDMLPMATRRDIVTQIFIMASLSEEAAKN